MLVFLRHGRTTANDVYSARRRGIPVDKETEDKVLSTPDWKQMLNQRGIEEAVQARCWIDVHMGGLATFDGLFTSYFARTRHTAALLGPIGERGWKVDDRLAEKHVGSYGVLTLDQRAATYPDRERLYGMSPWYTAWPGGENEPMVRERYRSFEAECLVNSGLNTVLIVAHAGLIGAARYHIENLLPEEHEALEQAQAIPIKNGSLLLYRKPEVADNYTEHRLVYPGVDDTGWISISPERTFSSDELLVQVDGLLKNNAL